MNFDHQQVSRHFQRWEFMVSETAARKGISNVPSAEQWLNLAALAETVLGPCREEVGPIRINSGYRSPALNVLVGGAANSQHLQGEAADIVAYNGTLHDLMKAIYYSDWPWDQLIMEFESWIHVSHKRGGPQRRQAMVATKVNGKTVYAPLTEV